MRPYLVFFPVIVGACAISGLGTAACAIGFSALALWYFFIPPDGFALPDASDSVHLCLFILIALFGCWIIDSLHRTNNKLTRDNVVLGVWLSKLLGRKRKH